MSNYDFSVITPVFNAENYLKETIESVLRFASDFNFEYLIVDDGSTDGTIEILDYYKDRVVVINQKNSGQPKAINNGLNRASGKYCIIVNADDPLVSNELFKKSFEILERNEEIVVTYPDWEIIDSKGLTKKKIFVANYSKDEMLKNFNCIVGPGGIFRTKTAKKIGGWDPTYKYVPDFAFWLELSTKGRFSRIPESLAVWREHEESLSVSGRSHEMAKERIRVIQEFLIRNPHNRKITKIAKSNSYYKAAILCFFDSNVPGLYYLFRAIVADPISVSKKNKIILVFLLTSPISSRIIKLKFIEKIVKKQAQKIKDLNQL